MRPRSWLVAAMAVLLALAMPFAAPAHSKKKKGSGKTVQGKAKPKSGGGEAQKPGKKSKKAKSSPPARRLSPEEILSSLSPVPVESPESLEPFFRSLRELREASGGPGPDAPVVRILHFGDSHVAADFWTGELRSLLQARFGDAGPGYVMPGKPWKYFRHSRAKSLGGRGWERCGLRNDPCSGLVGLSRVSLREGRPTKGFQPAGLEGSFRFVELQFAARALWKRSVTLEGRPLFEEAVSASAEGAPPIGDPPGMGDPPPQDPPQDAIQPGGATPLGDSGYSLVAVSTRDLLPLEPHCLEISLDGDALLLGADLRSGNPGVLLDTLGINGSELEDLECWAPGVRASLLRHAAPALVVVSFGTNDMGAKGFDEAGFRSTCLRVLRGLRGDAPDAAVLVTGPMDRGGKAKKSRALMQDRSEAIEHAMRRAALDAGCAFWDARAAMGGEGSMPRWAAAGLAQRDQVHLTEAGYRHIARLLFDALMDSYEGTGTPPGPPPLPEPPTAP